MKQSATTKAALPERIHIDGLNARLIIGTPDKATCSTATFAAELVLRWNNYEQMREALTLLFGMVESGTLVRDISHDHDPKWYLKALELTEALVKAKSALAQLERARE